MKQALITFAVFLMFFSSCKKKSAPERDPAFFNPPGVFVVNEGNFTTGNASLTWFGLENDTLMPAVFYTANKVPLGDVANFMAIYKDKGYIVINNSGLVYVVDISDGTFLGKVSGLSSPREILIIDDSRALISDLFDKYLTVINPTSYEITGKIDLHGRTSESMRKIDTKVFVANWSKLNQQKNNNQISVIDIDQLEVLDSIEVTKEPNSMVVDKNEKLWVLCSGGYSNTETPALYRINPVNDLVEAKLTLTSPGCPIASQFLTEAEEAIITLKGIKKAKVEFVFDPPWTPEKMSEDAKMFLGI